MQNDDELDELSRLETECSLCWSDSQMKMSLIEECGSTNYSLHNSHVLLRKHGIPNDMIFTGTEPYNCTVHFRWNSTFNDNTPLEHSFTGFAWLHIGESSRGHVRLLQVISDSARKHLRMCV